MSKKATAIRARGIPRTGHCVFSATASAKERQRRAAPNVIAITTEMISV
jgi:hypothetical protein